MSADLQLCDGLKLTVGPSTKLRGTLSRANRSKRVQGYSPNEAQLTSQASSQGQGPYESTAEADDNEPGEDSANAKFLAGSLQKISTTKNHYLRKIEELKDNNKWLLGFIIAACVMCGVALLTLAAPHLQQWFVRGQGQYSG